MRQATSRSGVLVVLKKTIVDCPLLHYFSGIKAPSNHTIPLLDVIDLSIEKTIIVLPWKSPLDEVLRFVTVLTALCPYVFDSLRAWIFASAQRCAL